MIIRYKVIGEKTVYLKYIPDLTPTPRILTFVLGESILGGTNIPIVDLTYSNVTSFLINTTGITPALDDINWSDIIPTGVNI